MAWFSKLISGKKNRGDIYDTPGTVSAHRTDPEVKKSFRIKTKSDRLALITETCEQILDHMKQIDEAKVEYQAVTSYLTDMQKLDLIPKEQRENLEDAARRILNLNKEREKFREKNTGITDAQYRLFERYELQLPRELEAIRESERYQGVIQMDLEQLQKEKQNLMKEESDIQSKHSFLKGIAVTTCVIIVLLFGVFAALGSATGANLTLPFLLTVLMGMATAMYIFMEARKNVHDIKIIELKYKRQVMLMNKVKLKSVNNRNYLEYTYSKYMVDNYNQLRAGWEEYIKVKDETRRFKNNTELLEFYNNELIHELKKFGIADSEIWIYQPSAILDSKEMVEVRHRLNVRRQKLRERIEMNSSQREEAVALINTIVTEYPDCEEEAIHILKRYRLQRTTQS